MKIFNSGKQPERVIDPEPWVCAGIRTSDRCPVTSAGHHPMWLPRLEYGRPFYDETNPILAWFREEHASEPNAYTTHEWLFQLGRHWAEWQDARMGSFPVEMHDPSGPVSRSESEEGGEDRVYWEIDECIRKVLAENGADITFAKWLPGEREQFREEDALKIDDDWTWEAPDSDRPNLGNHIQDLIIHAVAVIDRLDDWHTANGRGV